MRTVRLLPEAICADGCVLGNAVETADRNRRVQTANGTERGHANLALESGIAA